MPVKSCSKLFGVLGTHPYSQVSQLVTEACRGMTMRPHLSDHSSVCRKEPMSKRLLQSCPEAVLLHSESLQDTF